MGIFPILLIAASAVSGAASDGDYDVIRVISGKSGQGRAAEVEAYCDPQRKIIQKESYVDVILAIDTSFCNHYRIEQVKATVTDLLDTLTDTETGGQRLGENVRLSLVSFNSDIDVIFSLSDYDRSGTGSRAKLLQEISQLSFSDETTDFNNVFNQLARHFSRNQFRNEASQYLIVYTNGNQFSTPDYRSIEASLDELNLNVLGMSFSPMCDGEPTDLYNVDKVCPNKDFFKNVADSGAFAVPSHGTMMDIRKSLLDFDETSSSSSSSSMISDVRCETAFPAVCAQSEPGRRGPSGPPGFEGPQGRSGSAGNAGNDGSAGVDGPVGFSGEQGNRGDPGIHGEAGQPGDQGEAGLRGNEGRPGSRGRPGQSIRGEPGHSGPDGQQGLTGNPGRNGSPGEDGNPGVSGKAGSRGNAGNDGEDGKRGQSGTDGVDAICMDGPSGSPGFFGLPGENGNNGVPGNPGNSGTDGESGQPGIRGPQGATGQRGDAGETGPPGFDGCSGKDGADGSRGPPGETGQHGENGVDGVNGRRGDPGELGEIGLPGMRGEKGVKGDNGSLGPKGTCGHEGCDGPRGPTGPEGSAGEDGIDGVKGAKGFAGCPGKNGKRGPPGNPGVIDQDEVELLVYRAIRELLEECRAGGNSNNNSGSTEISRTDDIEESH